MRVFKNAVINFTLQTIQLSVTFVSQKSYVEFSQDQIKRIVQLTEQVLQNDLKKLISDQLIENNNIVLNIIGNINPFEQQASCDCALNFIKLKQLQQSLLKYKYMLKIIL